jgi:hypothetical protein
MPATEQTWRETKLLHKVFAVSSILMLIATIWMFVVDHSRPWKPYQRIGNGVEERLTDWRQLQFATNEAIGEHDALLAVLDKALRQPIAPAFLDEFAAVVAADKDTERHSRAAERLKEEALELANLTGSEEAEQQRKSVLSGMRDIVAEVRTEEETRLGKLKFARANRDAEVATLGLLVRDSKTDQLADQQVKVDDKIAKVNELQLAYDAAESQRDKLQKVIKRITADEDAAQEALGKNRATLETLKNSNVERRSTYVNWLGPIPLPGKKWLELPVLDAFNSPRKIDNLWSEGLVIDYNFSKVRRFDRCTTCHQSIQKSVPGSASDPAYVHEHLTDFVLVPPEQLPETTEGLSPDQLLETYYGLLLAPEGLLEIDDVTIQFVRPKSLAAQAEPALSVDAAASLTGDEISQGLMQTSGASAKVPPGLKLGDVIDRIDGDPVHDVRKALFRLLDAAEAGQTLTLTMRRGLPSPYTSHPRLDLFVGSLSPHKLSEFACTICHEGQGSATAFKWASHSPSSELQRKEWSREHGWFDNHHWIFPMYPERFAESSCLKCHHRVTELEPSERFPDPPAPKVVRGYNLIRKYGCFGCHEINGYDGGDRIGPDLRSEPNFFAAAMQLQTDPGFAKMDDSVKTWVKELAEHPERDTVRHRIYEALIADGESDEPVLGKPTHADLVPLFKDVENAGVLRKAGPSLRYAERKLDPEFMFDWIHEPKNFRPTTRMPQFFRLWDHLDAHGHGDDAEKFEPLEILGIVTYLRERSQDFDYLTPPEGVAEASAERGKVLFQQRGCLACHNHKDFADTSAYRGKDAIVQGPDLSGVGTKFSPERNPDGGKWLYSWIKEPSRYHSRTVMPDLFLDPIENAEGESTDPAADIVAYLLSASTTDWQAAEGTLASAEQADEQQLDAIVFENLKDTFAEAAADRYRRGGISAEMRDELKGAEVELLKDTEGAVVDGQLTSNAKLLYVGRRAIAKYGCYGCHDIPGFEDAKPIGTTLADWGRKDPSKLAFEHITHYLEGHGHGGHDEDHKTDDGETEEMRDYYLHQIEGHHRAGFIYQKLKDPRSYDYHKTENKKYNERLRMPDFPLTAQEREAIVTFVLGLVADPPPEKYIYMPDSRSEALIAGRQVLDKYNCGGCHLLEAERWDVSLKPDAFGEQAAGQVYPFLKSHFPPEQLAESKESGASGLLHAALKGMPALADAGTPLAYDDFGDPLEADENYNPNALEYPFDLWRPTVIDGNVFEVGVLPINVLAGQLEKKYATRGGFLAKYLLPHVVQQEKVVNPAAKGTEAWGWLPPPLIGEGAKVQTSWLHDFLLNPYPIRPATVLRMPRFNMSPEEATKLVNYFAALDNVEYPYESSVRQQSGYLAQQDARYQQALATAGAPASGRFADAMKIITNNNYCIKCHLVGDFEPKGADRAKAPNLAEVYRRLRPDYMRNWIANPKSALPYTSMPVNFPYKPEDVDFRPAPDQPVLYHGGSVDTVDALVDLLLNFDEYTKQRSLITPLVTGEAPPAGATAAVVPSPVRPTTPRPMPPSPKPAAKTKKPLPDFLKNLPEADGWGHVKVRFRFDGTPPPPKPLNPNKDAQFCGKFNLVDESLVVNRENGGIANVVGSLYFGRGEEPRLPIHESYLAKARDEVVMDNKGCRFEPHVAVLWTPQTMVFKNSDTVGHNTNYATFSPKNLPQNVLIPGGAQIEREFPDAERLPAGVSCGVHPWMSAKLVIKKHPYVGVSDKDGTLEIKNLPAGEWNLQFWHEKSGYVADFKLDGKPAQWRRGQVTVNIADGETVDLGVVEFVPK